MLTIGDVADRTGVSRRMLRHWEAEGLLQPHTVDPVSGYRRYTPGQAGRVHAIAALRALGFGLDEIRGLLAPTLTTPRLIEVLREREQTLEGRIASETASLAAVRRRLRSIEEGLLMTTDSLQLLPLPALRLAGPTADVGDETEIAHAVRALTDELVRLLGHEPSELVRVYDPAPDGGPITVVVGVEVVDGDAPDGLTVRDVPPAPAGAEVTYDGALREEGDAWLALDTALQRDGLTTAGAYRVRVSTSGVVLQAPTTAVCAP